MNDNPHPFYRPIAERHHDVADNRPTLDLRRYHWRQVHGDLEAFGTWYGTEGRPCLVIVPAHRAWGRRVVPCIIRMDSIWRFDEHATAGEPQVIREVAQELTHMCALLGLPPIPLSATRLLSIVRNHVGDVLSIPPRPRDLHRVVAEMEVTNASTGRTSEVVIHDDI